MILSYRQHGTTDWIRSTYEPTKINFTVTNVSDFLIEIQSLEFHDESVFTRIILFSGVDFRLEYFNLTLFTSTILNVVNHIPINYFYIGKLNDDDIKLYNIEFIAV